MRSKRLGLLLSAPILANGAVARCLAILLLSASALVGVAHAQHQADWNSTKSPDVARRLAQRSPFSPLPAVPFKSPVMRRLWEGKHHHRLTDKSQFSEQLTSPFLTTPPMYAAGSNPFDVALGDFNSDGKQDAIVAANPPVILLGNGDGTFQAAVQIGTIASAPTGVAVADFNHDGRLDVVFAISGAAVVYLGNGDGTFGAGVTFHSGGTNQNVFARVLAEDVNNDGIVDLILNTDAGVSALLGKGNGTFRTPKISSAVAQYMSVADFNKDGRWDLAVTDGFGSLSVLLGNGAGTFVIASNYSITPQQNLNALAIADYNQDGFQDVALPNGQVFLGNGDGTLGLPSAFPTAPSASVVGTADVNGDGITDLLTASAPGFCGQSDFGATGVSLGNGDGTFQPVAVFDSGGCAYPAFMAIGDLNNDAVPDIVVLSGRSDFFSSTSKLSVLINEGDGTFPAARLNISGGSGGVAVNDFNRDGNADVALADGSVYLGSGDGTLRFLASASLGGVAVATGDFNHDGNPDLAAAVECAPTGCSSGGQLVIAPGNGDGTFQASTALPSGGFYAESLAVADFNNDGNLDVALVNNCTDSACSAGGSVSIYLGNANGTFNLLDTINTISGVPINIVAGDFNNDGLTDLAIAGLDPGHCGSVCAGVVNVLLGKGNGSFQSSIVFAADIGITAAAVGDFNNDGVLDLALADGDTCADCGAHGQILYGNGDGTFTGGPDIPTEGGPPLSIVAADFYGTGTLTPVLANRCGDALDCPGGSVMIPGTENQTDIMLLFLAVGDFNNDGKPDLVGSLQYDAGASVLLNIGATAAATNTAIFPSVPQSYSAFQPVTFTAEVGHTGPTTPTGTVQFLDNGVLIASGSVRASLATTGLAVGSHFVVAYYQGDDNFAPSNSLGVHITINQANTITTLVSSQSPSQYGQKLTFAATVTGRYGGTATGTIIFSDGSKILGTSTLSGGTATFSIATLAVGFHSITAAYSGDTNFGASTSSGLTTVVNQAATTTALVSLPNPSIVGQCVIFIATVVPQYSGTPTGTVTFKNGTTIMGKVRLRGGQAKFNEVFKSAGKKSITAVYSGDANFTMSSAELIQTVNKR